MSQEMSHKNTMCHEMSYHQYHMLQHGNEIRSYDMAFHDLCYFI